MVAHECVAAAGRKAAFHQKRAVYYSGLLASVKQNAPPDFQEDADEEDMQEVAYAASNVTRTKESMEQDLQRKIRQHEEQVRDYERVGRFFERFEPDALVDLSIQDFEFLGM